MRGLRKVRARQCGFSLIEAMVSTFIFLAVLGSVYGAISSGRRLADVEKTYGVMEMDARKTLEFMSQELRMSGWRDHAIPGEPAYPYIFTNGVAFGSYADESHPAPDQHVGVLSPAFGEVREIVFKIPTDIDGNGILTDNETGEVEWSPYDVSYVLVTGANGVNTLVRREDGIVTDVLAHYVERVTFDTIYTDATIDMDEVVISMYMARPTPQGVLLETSLSTVVTMRNVDDAS